MFTGAEIVALLESTGITHVVTIPDSTIGEWYPALDGSAINVVRVCREGEAWGVAMGLQLGGAHPLVMIQCTGLFESGDALRNVLYDWKIPIPAIVGYRSYSNQETLPGDTCLIFTEPVLDAWKLRYRLIASRDQLDEMREVLRENGVALVAEGKA